jgi:hypothetical protein
LGCVAVSWLLLDRLLVVRRVLVRRVLGGRLLSWCVLNWCLLRGRLVGLCVLLRELLLGEELVGRLWNCGLRQGELGWRVLGSRMRGRALLRWPVVG